MNSSLKKYTVGAVVIIAFVAYLVFNSNNSLQVAITSPAVATNVTGIKPVVITEAASATTPAAAGNPPAASTATSAATATNTTTPASSGQYKDGTYTGQVASAFYGNLQVAAVIQNGAIADVQFLQYPQDNGHSRQVSAKAIPILKQEAIAAQSAQVNIVSGATATSQAFQQSLADALAQA
jgi:uncharacterized protein with FMN-binding domain